MNLTRGDTGLYKFQRLDSDGDVITTTPDAIYFTVKESYTSSTVAIQKTIDDMTMDDDGTWHFTIDPDDTNDLEYGAYVYDLEVTADEYVCTIAKGTLRILAEATWADDK